MGRWTDLVDNVEKVERANRPAPQPLPPKIEEPGMLDRAWRNIKNVGAETANTALKLSSGLGMAAQKFADKYMDPSWHSDPNVSPYIEGKAPLMSDQGAIEASQRLEDYQRRTAPPPAKNIKEHAVDIVSGLAPYLATGPVGAVSIIGNAEVGSMDRALQAGVSLPRSIVSGVIAGLTNAAMMRLPMGSGKQALASAAAMPAIGAGSRALQNQITDKKELHQDVFDPVALATDLAMGLGFSGYAHMTHVRTANRMVNDIMTKYENGQYVSPEELAVVQKVAKGTKFNEKTKKLVPTDTHPVPVTERGFTMGDTGTTEGPSKPNWRNWRAQNPEVVDSTPEGAIPVEPAPPTQPPVEPLAGPESPKMLEWDVDKQMRTEPIRNRDAFDEAQRNQEDVMLAESMHQRIDPFPRGAGLQTVGEEAVVTPDMKTIADRISYLHDHPLEVKPGELKTLQNQLRDRIERDKPRGPLEKAVNSGGYTTREERNAAREGVYEGSDFGQYQGAPGYPEGEGPYRNEPANVEGEGIQAGRGNRSELGQTIEEGRRVYPPGAEPKQEEVLNGIPDHVARAVESPREVPTAVGVATKQQTKDTLNYKFQSGEIAPDHPIRLTTVEELNDILRKGQLTEGSDYEGRSGISAQLVGGEKPIVAYGPNDKISAAIVFPPEASIGTGQGPNEVKIDSKIDPRKLRFVIDGHDQLLSFDDLMNVMKKQEVDRKAHEAATSPLNEKPTPSEAKIKAGTYEKGHVEVAGFKLSIENPEGSSREGVDKDGVPWKTELKNHYGYILGTKGADKDHIDAFIGPNPDSRRVFVVDQRNPETHGFDEHKVLFGFDSAEEARQAYLSNYDHKGPALMAKVTETTPALLRDWLENGNKKRPFAESPTAQVKYSIKPTNDPWYSKLIDVIKNKFSGRQGAQNAKSLLESWAKKGEFSKDELEDSGVMFWLEGQDKVTKEDLMDAVKLAQTDFRDVILGDNTEVEARIKENGDRRKELEKAIDDELRRVLKEYGYDPSLEGLPQKEWSRLFDEAGSDLDYYRSLVDDKAQLDREYEKLVSKKSKNKPQFTQYTTPGADKDSHRELFVTASKTADAESYEKYMRKDEFGRWWVQYPDGEWIDTGHKEYSFARNAVNVARGQDGWRDGHGAYGDIKNPIVRVRFHDRTLDGKRVLFVDEFQGPTGERTTGYRLVGRSAPGQLYPDRESAEAAIQRVQGAALSESLPNERGVGVDFRLKFPDLYEELYDGAKSQLGDAPQGGPRDIRVGSLIKMFLVNPGDSMGNFRVLAHKRGSIYKALESIYKDRMEPLTVEKADEWSGEQGKMPDYLRKRIYDIGVKRMLSYAKANGYDGIAWTPGDMQVRRWAGALRRAANELQYNPETQQFIALKDGVAVHSEKLTPKELVSYVGKENASKLTKPIENEEPPKVGDPNALHIYTGINGNPIYSIEGPLPEGNSIAHIFEKSLGNETPLFLYENNKGLFDKMSKEITNSIGEPLSVSDMAHTMRNEIRDIFDIGVANHLSNETTKEVYDYFENLSRENVHVEHIKSDVNTVKGDNITIDKKWPGDLYGDFVPVEESGTKKSSTGKTEDELYDDAINYSLDHLWSDIVTSAGEDINLHKELARVNPEWIKQAHKLDELEAKASLNSDSDLLMDEYMTKSQEFAQPIIDEIVKNPDGKLATLLKENGFLNADFTGKKEVDVPAETKFNSSAVIPSMFEKYGKNKVETIDAAPQTVPELEWKTKHSQTGEFIVSNNEQYQIIDLHKNPDLASEYEANGEPYKQYEVYNFDGTDYLGEADTLAEAKALAQKDYAKAVRSKPAAEHINFPYYNEEFNFTSKEEALKKLYEVAKSENPELPIFDDFVASEKYYENMAESPVGQDYDLSPGPGYLYMDSFFMYTTRSSRNEAGMPVPYVPINDKTPGAYSKFAAKDVGKAWWFNIKTGKMAEIEHDPNNPGHDSWLNEKKNAEELGVEPGDNYNSDLIRVRQWPGMRKGYLSMMVNTKGVSREHLDGMTKVVSEMIDNGTLNPDATIAVTDSGQNEYTAKAKDFIGVNSLKDLERLSLRYRGKAPSSPVEGRVLNREAVEAQFPGQKVTEEWDGFWVETPSGARIKLTQVGDIFIDKEAALREGYTEEELNAPGMKAVASYQSFGREGVIQMTEAGVADLPEEVFHAAMDMALTQKQRDAIIRRYGDEKAAASEYQRLKESGAFEKQEGNRFLGKLYEFFRKIRDLIFPNQASVDSIMSDIASGKIWGAPSERTIADWAKDTKVVDHDGKPVVVYHGTRANVNKFDINKIIPQKGVSGFWFTNDSSIAGRHATDGEGANVLPVYLNIKNPAPFEKVSGIAGSSPTHEAFVDALKAQGYDGVVMEAPGQETKVYLALEPDQIKSIYSGGIRYSIRDTVRRAAEQKDVKPVIDGLKDTVYGFKSLFAPSMVSREAGKAGAVLREQMGKKSRSQAEFTRSLDDSVDRTPGFFAKVRDEVESGARTIANKVFNKMTDEEKVSFMQAVDTGDTRYFSDKPELKKIADAITDMFHERASQVYELGTGALNSVRINYFPHIWKKMNIDTQKQILAGLSKRPLEGSKAFTKQRVFDDIQAGVDAGYVPVSFNPLDLVFLKMEEMDKYILAHRSLSELKKGGEVKVLKAGEKLPEGWARINDRYGTVYREMTATQEEITAAAKTLKIQEAYKKKAEAELVLAQDTYGEMSPEHQAASDALTRVEKAYERAKSKYEDMTVKKVHGTYIATEEVAQVFNNYLSKNLYSNKYLGTPFKAYMGAANMLNQFQLGVFSAFHGGFTTAEAMISHAALGIKSLANGDFVKAAKYFATAPAAAVTNPQLGNRVLEAIAKPGSNAELAHIVKAVELAGASFRRNEQFQTNLTQKMIEQWKNGQKVRSVLKAPFAVVEQSARPLMEWLVPRQKAGVFAEMVNWWMEKNPEATHEEFRTAVQQIWNRVDSRLGQVVYDRLFVHNVAKNVVQGLLRAPGWTGGTIIEVGGGIKDASTYVKDLASGKKPELSDRTAYTISLLIGSAIINGTLTALFTGDTPEGMDYVAFRTGNVDEDGRPERFLIPTYMKDIYAYGKQPGTTLMHKLHPMLALLGDVYRNRDYYGTEVYSDDANPVTKSAQVGKYALKAFVPFWIRGVQKQEERGGGTFAKTVPIIGIMPAPADMDKSKAERLMSKYQADRLPQGSRTEEETNRFRTRKQIMRAFKKGDENAQELLETAIKEGVIRKTDVKYIKKNSRKDYRTEGFKRLTYEQAQRVYDEATPEEQAVFERILRKKKRQYERNRFVPED